LAERPRGELLSLDDCIAIALRQQPEIRAQNAGYCAAVERQNIAHSYFLPQITLESRYTHLDQPLSVDVPNPITGQAAEVFSDAAAYFGIARMAGSAAANTALNNPSQPPFSTIKKATLDSLPPYYRVGLLGQDSLTNEILLVQPLWTGGKIRYREEQACVGAKAASADVAKSRQQVVFDVSRAYYGAQMAGEQQVVLEDAAGHFRAVESLIQALIDQGDRFVTTTDLHRTRALRLMAESEKVGTAQAFALAHEGLRRSMGMEQTAVFEIADRRLTPCRQEVDLSTVLSEAAIRRPELAKARLGVEMAELERELATANYAPDLALFSSFSTVDDNGGYLNPNDRQQWAVGVSMGVPLYQGGRRLAQQRQAQHTRAQATQVRRMVAQLIALEVQAAYLEHLEMSQRLPLSEAAVRESEATLQGYRDAFLGGQIKDEAMPDYFKDLLTARVLHSMTRSRYNDTVLRYNLALAKITLVTASYEYGHSLADDRTASVGVAGNADGGAGAGQAGVGQADADRAFLAEHAQRGER
jgi:outer membrane protein TolC